MNLMPKYVDVLAEYKHLPKDKILEELVWCIIRAKRMSVSEKHLAEITARCMKLAKVFSLRSYYKAYQHSNRRGSLFQEKWDASFARQSNVYLSRKNSIFWEHVLPEELANLFAVEYVTET